MKVWPKNDQMRGVLKHPSGRVGFPAEGPADWPEDQFTTRRIQDGDILTEEPGKGHAKHDAARAEREAAHDAARADREAAHADRDAAHDAAAAERQAAHEAAERERAEREAAERAAADQAPVQTPVEHTDERPVPEQPDGQPQPAHLDDNSR